MDPPAGERRRTDLALEAVERALRLLPTMSQAPPLRQAMADLHRAKDALGLHLAALIASPPPPSNHRR